MPKYLIDGPARFPSLIENLEWRNSSSHRRAQRHYACQFPSPCHFDYLIFWARSSADHSFSAKMNVREFLSFQTFQFTRSKREPSEALSSKDPTQRYQSLTLLEKDHSYGSSWGRDGQLAMLLQSPNTSPVTTLYKGCGCAAPWHNDKESNHEPLVDQTRTEPGLRHKGLINLSILYDKKIQYMILTSLKIDME